MPWLVPSYTFPYISNAVSDILIDQHLLNLECISRIVGILPDCHQTSVGIVNTNRPVQPVFSIGRPPPTENLRCRHRSPVSHPVGGLFVHHSNSQSIQRAIHRYQFVSESAKSMTGGHFLHCQSLVDYQWAYSPSLQRQHVAADAQRFSYVGTERPHIGPFRTDDAQCHIPALYRLHHEGMDDNLSGIPRNRFPSPGRFIERNSRDLHRRIHWSCLLYTSPSPR